VQYALKKNPNTKLICKTRKGDDYYYIAEKKFWKVRVLHGVLYDPYSGERFVPLDENYDQTVQKFNDILERQNAQIIDLSDCVCDLQVIGNEFPPKVAISKTNGDIFIAHKDMISKVDGRKSEKKIKGVN
jgi:hypothetical protein